MPWYVTQTGFDPYQDLWSGECTLVSPSVTTVLGCSLCIFSVCCSHAGLKSYLGNYWEANRAALLSQLTHNPLLTAFFIPSYSWCRETELVGTRPNQSLFIQVNPAHMDKCSHSESLSSELHRTKELLFTTSILLLRPEWSCWEANAMLEVKLLACICPYWTTAKLLTANSGKKYRNRKFVDVAEGSQKLKWVYTSSSSHEDQLFHSHFYRPLAKLLLYTLKCPTALSIQIMPGQSRLCYFLVWRNKRQMDSALKQHFVVGSPRAMVPFERMQSWLKRFQGMCLPALLCTRLMNKILAHHHRVPLMDSL